jgi:hypothetical protein
MKIVLLGSSPAIMLQALMLSNKYNDIELHEGKKVIGGSWKTSNFYNIKNVETGTHIFAPWKNNLIYKNSLKILKDKLGLQLYALNPSPEKITNNAIKKSELNKIKYYYVKGGANKIVKNIEFLLKKKKIKIFTNSTIKKIEFLEKKKLIHTNKKKILADQIYLPHYCNFEKNFLKKNDITLEKRKSTHLLLEFKFLKKLPKNFSYIQHPKFSNLVDRISKLSKNILSKNRMLICCRLTNKSKKNYKKNSHKLAKNISIELLKYLNFKNKKKFQIKYKYFDYETAYRNKKNLNKLKKFIKKNNLELVDTSGFIKYISKNLPSLNKLNNYE